MDKLNYYETWEGQRQLEKIVSNRILPRPNTKISTIVFLSIVLILIMSLFIIFNILVKIKFWIRLLLILLFLMLIVEFYVRIFIIEIIKCYQHYAKEETRRRCLCIPSCSVYSIQVLKKYPMLVALKKIHKRLYKTCNGEMYIIDEA